MTTRPLFETIIGFNYLKLIINLEKNLERYILQIGFLQPITFTKTEFLWHKSSMFECDDAADVNLKKKNAQNAS